MKETEYEWLIEQKKLIFNKTLLVARRLQDARRQIAESYVYALEKRFPSQETNELIEIADEDLQKSNEHYKKLTEKLIELKEFNHGPFSKLVELIKQNQP